jgi:hypothetical protein
VLAVVVMSFRNERTVEAAIDSLLAQDVPAEIVVAHSGGGTTPALVAERYPSVTLAVSEARRYPGGTRNAGVDASTAPFVAFLAADCVALPGWTRARVDRHLAGEAAVASALLPHRRDAPSLGASLLQHSNRLPGFEPAPHLRYGVSYSREVLAQHGPFPAQEGFPEDVAVNTRILDSGTSIAWAPEILTTHRYPTTLRALWADQHRRGRIHGALHGSLPWRALLAARVPIEGARGLRRGFGGEHGLTPAETPRAVLGLAVAVAGSASGKLRGGGPADPSAQAFCAARRAAHLRAWRRRLTTWRG